MSARLATGLLAALAALAALTPGAAASEEVGARGSRLAVAVLADAGATGALGVPALAHGTEPVLRFAQRSIEREWGPSEDSSYAVVEVSGWRSPGLAMGLSAAVPGAGQLYAGEGSGWVYAALEAASWVAYAIFRNRGHDRVQEAERFAGVPTDTTSRWSFKAYRDSTGQSTDYLERLYARDRDTFYDLIGRDPQYQAGWQAGARDQFWATRADGLDQLRRARVTTEFLWVHHLVSAFDALRAARIRNLPLERNLNLKLKTTWRRHGPEVAMVLERSF
jgi:hypothetical protein